ncbi:MAG: serine/threonine-protein kinase [Deltaproteobacteria bacterium]|nr:serine/threonine-protein kinase [Deltaproteobacteria bacterium]
MENLGVIASRRFGQYQLATRVGEGGMAEIFRAEYVDERGELRTAILKLLQKGADEEVTDLFVLEADLMNLLHHPNLVARLEVGEAGGRAFIAMEDLFGGDLRTLMSSHHQSSDGVPLEVTLHVICSVLRGLASFHQARGRGGHPLALIHGDVNPSNVFLSVEGEVKLGDFGVATIDGIGAGVQLPPGMALGKRHYFSPEIVAGGERCQADDLWAIGVMLYELVVGYRPFDGEDDLRLFQSIAAAKVDFPPGLVDEAMKKILQKALSRASKNRYPTAGALCGALVRYQLDEDCQLAPGAFEGYLAEKLGVIA